MTVYSVKMCIFCTILRGMRYKQYTHTAFKMHAYMRFVGGLKHA
ncbi:hypothetical protein Cassandra_0314 [Pseudomonas phage Cassandra]|uniref:Uncharacterized protein n=1 Tax=Pseudomonas phage vB_PaeM_PA5oct TaxID=2163605 RepID=A0A4Y5JT54_9CAUD|nr:hypothetical protein PQE65_gp438 [Pseudomonas phage vB_PaeM_PA5oct]WPK38990.1 hypothetical protein Cassandra_0314 [Pseudomonas phage Cassandra]WPK39510.1 hypothetical protein Deiofobo_0313 [Pseudomonas phage Deifobo]WPK40023.1 hypothetical protein ETTORE_0314 [Pseudomonas phage Ettore]WPK40545.1 hypothetical protein Paride_0315 [Pseudomonas phage Paride]QCG75927.1 hypothetical protein EST35_0044 [Pseudomonas phage vB_PaeM_PA5oct]